jgi:hypothetical protein
MDAQAPGTLTECTLVADLATPHARACPWPFAYALRVQPSTRVRAYYERPLIVVAGAACCSCPWQVASAVRELLLEQLEPDEDGRPHPQRAIGIYITADHPASFLMFKAPGPNCTVVV